MEGEEQKRFRKLRIAFSATCVVACVLLIALWVRSYWHYDFFYRGFSDKRGFIVETIRGKLVAYYVGTPTILDSGYGSHPSEMGEILTGGLSNGTFAGFRFAIYSPSLALVLPFWFFSFLSAALAAAPWIRWSKRFSLRTLLITMTLVAALLGILAISN